MNRKKSLVGPTITGLKDIELKVREVDAFNANHQLRDVIVTDDIDAPAQIKVTVSGTVGKPAAGTDETYELTYTAVDSDSNTTVEKRKVTVTNRIPTISGLIEITITEGDNIDLKSGITVNDFEDGDITKKLVCLTDLNTLTVGENTVYYSVTDEDGNTVNGERKVIVLEKEEQKPEVPSQPETPSNPGNGVIVNPETNNDTADKNENSSTNNNSNGANKLENPKTNDSNTGSYILTGIGALGLLLILNRRNRRKK